MPTSYTATLAIGHTDKTARRRLAHQLHIDGYEVLEASTAKNVAQLLDGYRPDLLLLGSLEQPDAAPKLLRALRAAELTAVARNMPVITIGTDDDVSHLRAYDDGSDHHVAGDIPYLRLRAILAAVARRCDPTNGHEPTAYERGDLLIDMATREVRIKGQVIDVPAREFELLRHLAAEPTKVMSKADLMRGVWGYADSSATRTLDSHACRLRRRLAQAGYDGIRNTWGVGYSLQ